MRYAFFTVLPDPPGIPVAGLPIRIFWGSSRNWKFFGTEILAKTGFYMKTEVMKYYRIKVTQNCAIVIIKILSSVP